MVFPDTEVGGRVRLPASKSISNRVLVIRALSGGDAPIENLSDCEDTAGLLRALRSPGTRFDVGPAGTAMRFLTAFLARLPGTWELTGSERMKQRPIGVLIDTLNRLGARIAYLEKEGCPPLRISGVRLTGGKAEMSASVSSQFVSALMMIAPYMERGLELRLKGKIVSGAYVDMTAGLMRAFGGEVSREGAVIRVGTRPYVPRAYRVEPDWTAASYFFELLAVAGAGEIRLPGLGKDSLQGDAGQTELWRRLGVGSRFDGEGIVLRKERREAERLEADFVEMPDLVQSFAVACCLTGVPFDFRGVETLRLKETDRIEALTAGLAELGFRLEAEGDSRLFWRGERIPPAAHPRIATCNDHRMAMAFAPAALRFPGLVIRDREVVNKSFPRYWEEIRKVCGG